MNRHKSSDTEQSRKIANLIQVCDNFVENNDYVNAIKSYSEIITIDDKNFHAWSNLGCLYNSLDLYDIALTCFENAQKLDFKPVVKKHIR
jgi:Tfp pilus assembly protein PilF